jgi:glyoxylase-like metal-dependent hydrolase (beta-lactamase superfamily II)
MGVYLFAKGIYHSTPVQVILEEGNPIAGLTVYHVPGHCPGQVCLRVDDILLTADHVLSHTTPHQAPESITLNMGLGHYLDSLDRIAALPGIRLALGGHEGPMHNLQGRIAAIKRFHQDRLQQVLAICEHPQSIAEISRTLFGDVSSYHVLLALEETGAHVEYLYQCGELQATNLVEIEREANPVILYQRT